ncbi:polysaccharide biosynthesis/export family protein [Fibrobacter sp. UWEL]|uniref:polysaccharide biosynthesis/export family protein n=1 Tax=Fibrobacter sp. UWEL TaxID=1896209 RepID=UPI000913CBE3|nr:polysaccharide biosynthesis/export family protein [Fibrobacter sp. UWEL]SHL44311.1 protein involved in polysaccharide export, contains SLBB domain of the beta-grasp fold [Fibrobacter sp. UWEL]
MQRLIAVLLLLCVGVFAAESSFGSLSSVKASGPSSRSSIALTPASAEVAVDSSYILGPGDFLDVMLENSYLTVQVAPDGTIAIEECGVANIGGKTLAEAKELILDLAARRYKREFCYVQLAALKKFKVNAMGAVGQIGQHMVDPQTRLSYFIRQMGGTVTRANTEDVQVIRGKDTLHVNYSAMSIDGNFDDDIMLEQGDKIYVPYVGLGDNVAMIFPGYKTSVAYKEGRTLQEYFELAGGARLHSFGYKAACVREPGKAPRWISVTEMGSTVVSPNTEVEFSVQEMLVYVGGAVNFLGRYPYDPSWRVLDYVAAAGLNTISGSWSQIRIWRGTEPEAISVNVATDQVMPGDYIEIPKSHYESFKDFTLFLASLLTVLSSAFIIYVNYK